MTLRDKLDRGTYVAHRAWRNGEDDGDNRAQRRCTRCGGAQYDWGVNFTHTGKSGRHLKRARWFMAWYCNGRDACGLYETEYMPDRRINSLRQDPPKVGRAPGAPWKRWRDMQQRTASHGASRLRSGRIAAIRSAT